ncbi:MAG: hypothetical protein HF300_07655 [Ignavibacteria bacterium]|nr:hypothetical protein [Ignavibacteria bacterium]MCU7499009.1 hypothetical protein [Ignavibacteria bacterium]MCU7512417.1 hypothetical protein [Ignavibacteria bacterium]MCU7518612.1 hypothetical protein [Ignavibacteria bacterium]
MKLRYLVLLVFATGFLFYSCKKSSTEPTAPEGVTTAKNYYPGGVGSRFVYSVDTTGAGGALSTRTSVFTGTKTINGTEYISQVSSVKIGPDSVKSTMYFRRSDVGVYFYIDTTGLSKFFPDSIKSQLTLQIDNELRAFNYPLDKSLPWSAFRMNVKYGSLITLNIIDLTANYQGSESLTLNLSTGQKTLDAEKIRYDFILTIPDLNNPLNPSKRTFNADAWFVKDIGVVRFQGNGTILGALSGGGINFADTTKTVSQNLTSYDIK